MPFFISNEAINEMAAKARRIGFQEGYSDGQRFGEQSGQAQCLEKGYRFRVDFEVELNQPQLLPQPANFLTLIDQLNCVVRDAKRRWERAEQKLEAHQREYNPATWKALSEALQNSQFLEEGLAEELADAKQQLEAARQYCRGLEKKIRELERVIAGLQNTLDRANKQGK
jgi:Rad3-related DNA helicase